MTLEFTAHPLALRIGARLRLRSFSHAITIDGPEMTSMMPKMVAISCIHPRLVRVARALARKVPMDPRAIPIIANIPANLDTSKALACFGASWAGAAALSPAALIFAVASVITLESCLAAILLI